IAVQLCRLLQQSLRRIHLADSLRHGAARFRAGEADPCAQAARVNRVVNIPYSALVLVFVGSIFPVQIAIAEAITGWFGVRNIFNLNFETGGSIPLVVLAMLLEALVTDFFFYWFHRANHRFGAVAGAYAASQRHGA